MEDLKALPPLDAEQKLALRRAIILEATKLEGIPYREAKIEEEYGKVGKWTDFSKLPENLDCSGLVASVFRFVGLKIPDGSQNQYNDTIQTAAPHPGDMAFFGHDKNPLKVYHVGVVYDDKFMIEARDFDPKVHFPTGRVILRERAAWENWKNFLGYRAHARLI